MSMSIAPIARKSPSSVPLNLLLTLNAALKKSVFSRKFYQEITDKVLTNSSNVDANLYFICYFTLLVSSVLNNKHKIRKFLHDQRVNLVQLLKQRLKLDFSTFNSKLSQKLFNTDPYVEPAHSDEKPVSGVAVHLKAISSYLADIRIFNRLTDSIKYMPWIIDEFTAFMSPGSAVPRFDRFVNLLQSLNCLVLELLENAGWLTEHNWVGTNDNNYWCIETYIWCCRVWGAYLIIEIIELFRRTPVSKWDKNWKIAVFKQVIQVPLVIHWSLYDGCLSPFWVGVCGSGASWWGFKDLWSSIDLS